MPPSSLRKSVLGRLAPEDSESIGGAILPSTDPLPTSTEAASLSPVDQGTAFRPTEAQVRVKAKFWSKWADQPLINSQTPTLALVRAITGSAAVGQWWQREAFRDWFLNTQVTDERVEYLLHLALSAAEDILLNDDPKAAGARVSMIKTVAEMSGKMTRQAKDPGKAADKKQQQIQNMGREELLSLLQQAGLRVETTINLPVESKDERGPA